jgi:hypothetical protein
MACTDPCSCCYGACCTAGECSRVTCEVCESGGGEWLGKDVYCTPNPCEECTVDEECCFDATYFLVPPCTDPASGEKCCPPGSVAWVDNAGDPRYGNCVDGCGGGGSVVASPGNYGSCCDNQCYAGYPCPP